MRVLCLDVGDKYIGVAISDVRGVTAHGLKRIERGDWIHALKSIIEEYHEEIGSIVVGLPRMLNGSVGIQGEKVLKFTEELKKVTSLPVILWDERLSTAQAERVMLEAGMLRKKRKAVRDVIAATLILQNYLDSRSRNNPIHA